MTRRERAPTLGPDVIAGTPGGSMKCEAEAARGAGGGAGATCGADWGVRAVRGAGGGTGATCGATIGSELPVIEEG
jgi:hypothetical protein